MTPEQQAIVWLSGQRGRGFVWGETDCVTLTFRVLDRWTGLDISGAYAGRWQTEAEALDVYREGVLPSSYLKQHGAWQILPEHATVGDVIAIPSPQWPEQLHFVTGRHATVCDEAHGVCLARTSVLLDVDGATVWRMRCRKPSH